MRFKKVKSLIKKYDFVELKTNFNNTSSRCLVVSLGKDVISILPIFEIDGISVICPLMIMPYKFIKSLVKIKLSDLLFYSNMNNPHVNKAILKSAGKRSK